MSSSPFESFDETFTSMFGGTLPNLAKKQPEKGVPWEAKVIDGAYYVPLSQVADLLKANKVLPAVTKGIVNRVEMQRMRKEMGI